MDVCRRDVPERGQIDIAPGLASGTLDLKPWVGTVDGLIDGGTWIDRAPSDHMPSFQDAGEVTPTAICSFLYSDGHLCRDFNL